MYIAGFQKLTLLDYPGKVAATVFLQGCNLRCPFCHNSQIITAPQPGDLGLVSPDEVLATLRKRVGILEGVCITGGEPLVSNLGRLADLLGQIKELGYAVKLDTNGCFPTKLRALVEAGLVDYVALDVKNSPERYAATVGLPRFDTAPVDKTIQFLLEGSVDYEMRTTVAAELHDRQSFRDIAAWICGCKRYYLQPFVDRETVPDHQLHAPSAADLDAFVAVMRPFVDLVEVRGQ